MPPSFESIPDVTPEAAWQAVRTAFPFPNYLDEEAGQIGVARTVHHHLAPGARILDFGSGPCDKTAVLAAMGYQCTAADDLNDEWHLVDGNRDKIKGFAEAFGIKLVHLEAGSSPSTDEVYDMVMLHDVLEHLHDSPRDLLVQLLRLLKPSGFLYVTVPNHVNARKRLSVLLGKTSLPAYPFYYWSPGPWRGHVREYTKGDCKLLAEYLGLEVLELRGVHHMLRNVPVRLRALYVLLTRLTPGMLDTWSLVAQKRPAWAADDLVTSDRFQSRAADDLTRN